MKGDDDARTSEASAAPADPSPRHGRAQRADAPAAAPPLSDPTQPAADAGFVHWSQDRQSLPATGELRAAGRHTPQPGGGRWKWNLQDGQPVWIRLRGHKVRARPELIKDPDEIERLLAVMTAGGKPYVLMMRRSSH